MRLQPWHRVRRFVAALRPSGPADVDLDWARSLLSASEYDLLTALPPVDQAHVVRVGRSVESTLRASTGPTPDRSWLLPAALLHDVGKLDAPLAPVGRAVVTVVVWAGGRSWAANRQDASGWLGAAARYATYPERGAHLLTSVGSDARVAAWAREHHLPPERWTVPAADGALLAGADDEA